MTVKYTNIIFDIGRVLIDFEWDEYMKKLFDDESVRLAVTEASFGGHDWDELDRGILEADEVLKRFVTRKPEYAAEIREAFERVGECTGRVDYAIPWIEELRSQGYNVYYLSNYSYYVQSVSGHALDFLKYMDGGVFSCEAKSVKPEPAIYEALFEKYKLKPEECIFIDDRPANIEAGKAYGMDGIVFADYEQAHRELQEKLEG